MTSAGFLKLLYRIQGLVQNMELNTEFKYWIMNSNTELIINMELIQNSNTELIINMELNTEFKYWIINSNTELIYRIQIQNSNTELIYIIFFTWLEYGISCT